MSLIKQFEKAGVYFIVDPHTKEELLGESAEAAYTKLVNSGLAKPQKEEWCPVTAGAALSDFGDSEMAGDYLVYMQDDDGDPVHVCLSDTGYVNYI